MDAPETRYARTSDGVHLAYQVFGEGDRDVVFVWGIFSHVELAWEHEASAHYLRRLGSFARIIHFDKRGTGLSDRACPLPTLEDQMDDVQTVMDAVGLREATLIGGSDAGLLCMLFAAAHPERTTALVLSGSRPRITSAPDFPWGPLPENWHETLEYLSSYWGFGVSQSVAAPTQADPASRQWWARLERYSLSPGSVMPFWRMLEQTDVRHVLSSVHVPTLVLHRRHDPYVEVDAGRFVAEHIGGARFVELAGYDHAGWGDGADSELDHIEEMVTGARGRGEPDRVLATVLFTDIVGSTEQASEVGDRRWRELLADHDHISLQEIDRHRGRWVKSTGDGVLATFDGPARAIRCAERLAARTRQRGLRLRAGIHTGECEQLGDDIGGIAVHIAARVAALAPADTVLVSRTVVDLVAGSGVGFEDQGEHELRGVPGQWRLFRVA